jgi:hypothetical protein
MTAVLKGSGLNSVVRGAWAVREKLRLPQITDEQGVARVLGIPYHVEAGRSFPCPMPGHPGNPAGFQEEDGEIVLVCACFGSLMRPSHQRIYAEHAYSLADVFFSIKTHTVLDRHNYKVQGRFLWRLLLLEALGYSDPVPVPPLPDSGTLDEHEVRDLFVKLVGARTALQDHIGQPAIPTPMGHALIHDWCGITRPGRTIQGLLAHGVIDLAGEDVLRPGQARPARLYRPGLGEE